MRISADGITTIKGETYLNNHAVLRTNNTYLYGVTSGNATVSMIGMRSDNWIRLAQSGYGFVSGTGGFSVDGADNLHANSITAQNGQFKTASGVNLQLVPNTGVASVAGQLSVTSTFTAETNAYVRSNLYTNSIQQNTAGELLIGNGAHDVKIDCNLLSIQGAGASAGIKMLDNDGNTDGWFYALGGTVGILDSGGTWAYRHANDSYHAWDITGTKYMELTSTQLAVTGNLRITGKLVQGSDINLKTNISTIETPLDKISKIRGVQFDWKSDNETGGGVIAQELEKVCPEFVHDIGNGTGHKSVDYNGVMAVMIESIKELKQEIEMLKECKCNCNCKGE